VNGSRNSFELDVRCQGFMSDSDEEIDGKEKGGSRNGHHLRIMGQMSAGKIEV
jgi:hypothetical protein